MWTCAHCGAENAPDTLECHFCGKIDHSATSEELAAWRAVLNAEAAREERKSKRRPTTPRKGAGFFVVAIVLAPSLWNAIEYRRADVVARRFDQVASCHGNNGAGTPSPPCSTEPMDVEGGHSRGFMEHVPRHTVSHFWVWLSFDIDLVDEAGIKHIVSVIDQPTLNTVIDEQRVGVVKYNGTTVGIDGPAGYFQTLDNPDVVRDDHRTDLIRGLSFAAILAAAYIFIDVSGRLALKSVRGHHGPGRSGPAKFRS